ncbi:hypothetical protein V6V47_07685 [Micromonospora sp. CPCC 205539]|uniref:hypothetical protein n=1 Tax=Micromonospora sp. CPCC 205539 TaxID=3122408 RepID=UPI002FF1AA13
MQSDSDDLAAWCALLPALREQARASGVLDRLDRDAERVRAGASAHRALLKWRPPADDAEQRGWSDRPTVGLAGLPGMTRAPGVGAGDYRCPRDRCVRHATRDDDGHPPRCTAFDLPMRPA